MTDLLIEAIYLAGLLGLYTAGAIVASVVVVAAGMKICEVIDRG